jgi:prepilin-type N-terminal cleavage/methylation domain-containing protein
MKKDQEGFTLIELMLVVVIIGVLAAIAIPQFSNMVAKSQEGSTKGNLGTLRSAISVYYGDNDGEYPMDTLYGSLLPGNKYLQGIPPAFLPLTTNNIGHGMVLGIKNPPLTDVVGHVNGWVYDNSGNGNPTWGQVVVNCTHQDLLGNPWSGD